MNNKELKPCFYKLTRQEVIYLKEKSPWYGKSVSSNTHHGDLCYGIPRANAKTTSTVKVTKWLDLFDNSRYFRSYSQDENNHEYVICSDSPAAIDLRDIDYIAIINDYEIVDIDTMTLPQLAEQISVKDFKAWIKDTLKEE